MTNKLCLLFNTRTFENISIKLLNTKTNVFVVLVLQCHPFAQWVILASTALTIATVQIMLVVTRSLDYVSQQKVNVK